MAVPVVVLSVLSVLVLVAMMCRRLGSGERSGFLIAVRAPTYSPSRLPTDHDQTIGNTSVQYSVGMFSESSKKLLASGKFVHVFVSAAGRPLRIPDEARALLESIRTSWV